MQLSVIILNYNVRYFLEHCLKSVQKAIENLDAQIIVVDNNSPDDSCEMVKTLFPKVILIENNENAGFPKGNNIGVQQAKGKYICILNPDTVVAEDTFEKILAFAEKQEKLGIIGCKLIDGTGKFLPESKRGIPTTWVAFGKIAGLYKLFPKVKKFQKYYAQHLDENSTGQVDILVGAFMVLQKATYEQLGGFDERYFMYGEDIDLSYRILKAGFKNYYFGEIQAVHFKGESTTKDQVYLERFYNAMYIFYKKHFRNYKTSYELVKQILKLAKIIEEIKLKSLKPMDASKRYTLIITEDSCLTKQIKSKIATEVNSAVKIPEEFTNTLIVFDAESISYKESIEALINTKHKNNIFRYRPRKQNFIIGSESKHFKGVILKLNE